MLKRRCKHKQREEEIEQLLTLALIAGGVGVFAFGFRKGWNSGQTELLVGLQRAQRIHKHLSKEQ